MKANRRFVMADDAVSPVIAVILMVAITVVLAATVFVLVQDLSGKQSVAPSVNFQVNDSLDRIEVVSASTTADWNRLEISTNQSTVNFTRNADVAAATGTAVRPNNTWIDITSTVLSMNAGDFLDLCGRNDAGTGNEARADVKLQIRDISANQVIADNLLVKSISACA